MKPNPWHALAVLATATITGAAVAFALMVLVERKTR